MMRIFDVSSDAEARVPVAVIETLHNAGTATGTEYVLVGAVARDLVIHAVLGTEPARATTDVDVAVAVRSMRGAEAFVKAAGGGRIRGGHRIVVSGVDVDVIPFGDVENDGQVQLAEGRLLDVTGMSEAAMNADLVTLRSDLTVRVASMEAMALLKVFAWRDRGVAQGKDALDLCEILAASSEGVYGDEAWDDPVALAAVDHDIRLAGPFRAGATASTLLDETGRGELLRVLAEPGELMAIAARARVAHPLELLTAYRDGVRSVV